MPDLFKHPVEQVITDMKVKIRDPDIAMLFADTFPSTLDTTVRYFDKENLAFIITKQDISSQWLRDTGNQFAHLYPLLPHDPDLQALVKAVINTGARYIAEYPYRAAPGKRTFELDSLSAFLKISWSYYKYTNDSSFININWRNAISQIMTVLHNQSQGTWDDSLNFISYYNWTGTDGYGGQYIMDDANVPSLVSLPYLGFLPLDDPRANGSTALAAHTSNATYPWPMSQISAIYGTDDDEEIVERLYTIANNTAGLGLIHEAINIYQSRTYTRPWFAWANSYFAEMILDLARRKPGLIFHDAIPYEIGSNRVSM
ncbi:Six-hairpin glycosidase-like protein [Podospora didyma]|uniref:Six-hairpin glycosidase-like protein n=1 Tax=Podospora didyma TaxID=330526 RepID=A0AAE0NYJ6_9PEZI|nr:Six-hairpin glycosidase-like protein [Podospora didyma]